MDAWASNVVSGASAVWLHALGVWAGVSHFGIVVLRFRYYNHLSPDINKNPWTSEEDQIIIFKQVEMPNKWAVIAKDLFGR